MIPATPAGEPSRVPDDVRDAVLVWAFEEPDSAVTASADGAVITVTVVGPCGIAVFDEDSEDGTREVTVPAGVYLVESRDGWVTVSMSPLAG